MKSTEAQFMNLVRKYSSSHPDVILGKMMSSPGLKYRDKVFAFFHKGEMGFRLGPEFDPVKFGVLNAKPLSPFKTKPPLKGWYLVAAEESNSWDILAEMAMDFTVKLDK
jgi:hypothetical protein